MNLEVMLQRLQEIEAAIVNVANQYQVLVGHKTEAQHWISEFQKPADAASVPTVDEPVATPAPIPVE